ncbi:hypothetical protein JTB14_032964 [Gonioctena quinquepunctata]|nr:hypothetical protein JTB14_032964 [Gonioctena quinquepunctata]
MEKFLNRHKDDLSKRISQSIKQSRAKIDHTTINGYFDNLSKVLKDVHPEGIVNYNETNFTDDPGHIKVIVRKQSKRAEKVMDTSKSSTSVMFSCSASGVMLPPYIVYKADHLWSTWIEGGPPNTRYNRIHSGWFNTNIFEDWFMKIALPYFTSLPPGRKVLIGDNLASHISLEVITTCENSNISFVLLSPNSTHLKQPLDVSVLPVKIKWRQVLKDWKAKNRRVIKKDVFPRLLRQCLESINVKNSQNIKSGFEATGIAPIDRQKILQKLPKTQDFAATAEEENTLGETLKQLFQEARFGKPGTSSEGRKKKISVEPGKSICSEDIANTPSENQKEKSKKKTKDKPKTKPKRKKVLSSSERDEDILPANLRNKKHLWTTNDDSDDDVETFSELDNGHINDEPTDQESVVDETYREILSEEEPIEHDQFKCGDYILVNLKTENGTFRELVAKIVHPQENGYLCTFLRMSEKVKNTYIYPAVEDIGLVEKNEIKIKLTIAATLWRGQIKFRENSE